MKKMQCLAPDFVVSKVKRELKRKGVPENFVKSILYHEGGKNSWCYFVFQDKKGDIISGRSVSSEEIRKSRIIGVDLELISPIDVYHEVQHTDDIFKAVMAGNPNECFADPVYKELKAYAMKLREE